MNKTTHFVSNRDGWKLALKCIVDPERFDPTRRPVVIVPGYGMNAYIFGYHPNGLSLEDYLAQSGVEVWSVNLRTQGESVCEGGSREYGMREVSLIDIPAALDYILEHTGTRAGKVDLLGCSLGGTMVYVYAALAGTARVGAIASMGAPLRWDAIHPVLRIAFSSPRVARQLKLKGTRTLARFALPVMAKCPALLSIYLHPDITDISHPEMLVKTVEDPNSMLNGQISEWIINKDLVIDGENVTERFAAVTRPLFLMLANADGIVPPETALSAMCAASAMKEAVTVGDEAVRLAHADMFISRVAQDLVFRPLAQWLEKAATVA